jgi:GT2 family glycosyltransferase
VAFFGADVVSSGEGTGADGPRPRISLLIAVHNRLDLTRACLASVFAHADPTIPIEIIVVDDCSTDGTADYLETLGEPIRVLRNSSRSCFGQNMNKAAQAAHAPYLVLLNNDTEATPGWLRPLLDAALCDARIGVVGNRHLYPETGTINHAGVAFDDHGRPVHLYPDKPADFPPANVSRDVQAVTGACWLVPRAVFAALGGFDPQFRNGHEDIDFCLRAAEQGYKIRYVAESVIYHHVGSSSGRFDNESENERYFLSKWQGRIRPDLNQFLARDGQLTPPDWSRPLPGAPALSIGRADVHFAIPLEFFGSFCWVTSQLALACERAGMRVSLLNGPIDPSIEAAEHARLRQMMERPASARAQVKWTHFWAPYADQELGGRINAEIFCTNYRYGPRPPQDLDQWMRHVVLNDNRKLAASQYCLDALTELGVPAKQCRVVPYGYSPEILQETGVDDSYRRHGFVFLALTNGHDPLRYGTDILLAAFTRAFAGRRDVVLVLKDYGGAAREPLRSWLRQIKDPPRVIHVPAFTTKSELIQLYRGADAFVAPFRGEGFALKLLDACAVGLPILAPVYGGPADYLDPDAIIPLRFREVAVGACHERKETIVPAFARWAEVDVDDLARALLDAKEQGPRLRQRAVSARERVLAEFSWARAAEKLATALDEFESERLATIRARNFSARHDVAISVIIPTRDRPAQLARTLAAYERQTLPAGQAEIIVSDDASNYDIEDRVAPFRERLSLRIIKNSIRSGAGGARNAAIPLARGELVLFAGDDILPNPDFLATHIAAHRKRDDPRLAVLGRVGWHPDVPVSRLMRYVTGEGGHQFAYQHLTPGDFVDYGYFYTANISLPRRLLERQEELFNPKFTGYGFEDIELGLRLARDGMRLLYVPEAAASRLRVSTDEAIFSRQYAVGRALIIYAMLHPRRVSAQHVLIMKWLELYQHQLAEEPEFVAIKQQLADAGEAIAASLESMAAAAAALSRLGPSLTIPTDWSTRLIGSAGAREGAALQHLDNMRLHLAEQDGMADAWLGIPRGAVNPARDLLRVLFFGTDRFASGLSGKAADHPVSRSRLYALVHRVRHHPLLSAWGDRLLRMPVAVPVIESGMRLLRRLP